MTEFRNHGHAENSKPLQNGVKLRFVRGGGV